MQICSRLLSEHHAWRPRRWDVKAFRCDVWNWDVWRCKVCICRCWTAAADCLYGACSAYSGTVDETLCIASYKLCMLSTTSNTATLETSTESMGSSQVNAKNRCCVLFGARCFSKSDFSSRNKNTFFWQCHCHQFPMEPCFKHYQHTLSLIWGQTSSMHQCCAGFKSAHPNLCL